MKKTISFFVLVAFIFTCVMPPHGYAQTALNLPAPGAMVSLSPAFTPALLKGIKINAEDPFKFDFIINKGDESLAQDQKKEVYTKLIKYFLASLAVPDQDQWVNLSPYEKDRIIKEDFGKTEMGRDLLAQDYLLKQITSSVMFPDSELGKTFWARVYQDAAEKFGTTDIPVDTFNKVWITPDEAVVYEKDNVAYIGKSHLKVQLESDYLAMSFNALSPSTLPSDQALNVQATEVSTESQTELTKQIIREVILPAIEKEVNEGKNFALLRQVFSGMILATWYKLALKESLLGKVYADQSKVKGVDQKDAAANQVIYAKYVEAFKTGVYNYIKEEYDVTTQTTTPRKYFSGGVVKGLENLQRKPVTNFTGIVNPTDDAASVTFDPVEKARVEKKVDHSQLGFLGKVVLLWTVLSSASLLMDWDRNRSVDNLMNKEPQQLKIFSAHQHLINAAGSYLKEDKRRELSATYFFAMGPEEKMMPIWMDMVRAFADQYKASGKSFDLRTAEELAIIYENMSDLGKNDPVWEEMMPAFVFYFENAWIGYTEVWPNARFFSAMGAKGLPYLTAVILKEKEGQISRSAEMLGRYFDLVKQSIRQGEISFDVGAGLLVALGFGELSVKQLRWALYPNTSEPLNEVPVWMDKVKPFVDQYKTTGKGFDLRTAEELALLYEKLSDTDKKHPVWEQIMPAFVFYFENAWGGYTEVWPNARFFSAMGARGMPYLMTILMKEQKGQITRTARMLEVYRDLVKQSIRRGDVSFNVGVRFLTAMGFDEFSVKQLEWALAQDNVDELQKADDNAAVADQAETFQLTVDGIKKDLKTAGILAADGFVKQWTSNLFSVDLLVSSSNFSFSQALSKALGLNEADVTIRHFESLGKGREREFRVLFFVVDGAQGDGTDQLKVLKTLPLEQQQKTTKIINEFLKGRPGEETDAAMMVDFKELLEMIQNIPLDQIDVFLEREQGNLTPDQRRSFHELIVLIQGLSDKDEEKFLFLLKEKGYAQKDFDKTVNRLAGISTWTVPNSLLKVMSVVGVAVSFFGAGASLLKANAILSGTSNSALSQFEGGIWLLVMVECIVGVFAIMELYKKSSVANKAFTSDKSTEVDNASTGGIDLNAMNMNLQIKRDGNGIALPVDHQNIENIHIEGLVPLILNIQPVSQVLKL